MDLHIEYIPLSKLKRWPRNPKEHSDQLEHSITELGFVEPLIIDETTGQLVAGHGRLEFLQKMQDSGKEIPQNIKLVEGEWAVPTVRGVEFESIEAAEKFLLSTNLLPAAGGWNDAELEEMLKDVTPFGIEVNLDDVEVEVEPTDLDTSDKDQDSGERHDANDLLDGVYRLEEGVYFFPDNDSFANQCVQSVGYDENGMYKAKTGANPFGIPNLDPNKLVEELPEDLLVWGGRKQTKDDQKSWFLWNYGAVPEEGLPFDRSILSFFTHDTFINPWWTQTSYHVAEYIKNGGTMAIVPDCSIWNPAPQVLQMLSVYKANWIGRWMQETGRIKVIPRLEFFVDQAKEFSLCGIPFESPIVATQMHTKFMEEDVSRIQRNLEKACKILRNKTLLVYVSERGRKLVEDTNLPCNVVMLETAKKFRAPRKKVEDPELKELMKRRKDQDPSFINNPEY